MLKHMPTFSPKTDTGSISDVIEPAGYMRLTGALIGLLFVAAWAAISLIPVGAAVVGTGQVNVESHVKRVSHLTGGPIARLFVREGQHVAKGQLLIQLDDRVSSADAQFSNLSVDQMLAQQARLQAERLGSSAIRFPSSLMQDGDESKRRAMAEESSLFLIHRSEWSGLAAQLRAREMQYAEEIKGYRGQIASVRRQRTLINPERDGIRKLYEKQLVTIGRMNAIERSAAELDGTSASLSAQIAQAQARIAETRQQMIQMAETRRSDAGTQLAQLNATLNQQNVRLISAMTASDQTAIRAPAAGIIDKLTVNAVGDIVRPAEMIMEIVPDKDRLVVEAMISPADVDQIHTGQRARVRLAAINVGATPELRGTIQYIGANKVTSQDGTRSSFPVKIEIDKQDLANYRGVLKTGMPAEVFVVTGSRSMMSYLTKPLRDQFARAFIDG